MSAFLKSFSSRVALIAWRSPSCGLSQLVVGHSMRPEINGVACIPLNIYAFSAQEVSRKSIRHTLAFGGGAGRAHDLRRHVCIRMSGHLSRRVLRLFCRLKMAQSAFLDVCDCLRVPIAGAISAPRISPMLADQPSFEDSAEKGCRRRARHRSIRKPGQSRTPNACPYFRESVPAKLRAAAPP